MAMELSLAISSSLKKGATTENISFLLRSDISKALGTCKTCKGLTVTCMMLCQTETSVMPTASCAVQSLILQINPYHLKLDLITAEVNMCFML